MEVKDRCCARSTDDGAACRINYTYEITWRHAGRRKVYVQRKVHFDMGERTNARLWSLSISCVADSAGKASQTVLSKVSNLVPNSQNWKPMGPNVLVTPISLDEIGSISRHPSQEALGPKHPNRSPISHRAFPTQPNLHMSDAQREQRRHGITQHRPVGAIELSDGGENEREGHVLEEIQMAATLEEQRIRVVGVAGGVVLVVRVVEVVADPLLVLDALVDDAVAEEEEVDGEGDGPGARDGFCDRGGQRMNAIGGFAMGIRGTHEAFWGRGRRVRW